MTNQSQKTMKTKTLYSLCLFMCMALAQISAQSPVVTTGAKPVSFKGDLAQGAFAPVYCDGALTDYLTGPITFHDVWHYIDGLDIWCIYQINGVFTSQITGEVFVYKEMGEKHLNYDNCIITWPFNMRGDQGTQYIGTLTWDFCSNIFYVDKAVCD